MKPYFFQLDHLGYTCLFTISPHKGTLDARLEIHYLAHASSVTIKRNALENTDQLVMWLRHEVDWRSLSQTLSFQVLGPWPLTEHSKALLYDLQQTFSQVPAAEATESTTPVSLPGLEEDSNEVYPELDEAILTKPKLGGVRVSSSRPIR